jgi:predicted Fe-Mo cluster-binding NifX family protein
MRIAIATDGDYVAQHFGKCLSYTIFDIDNGEINGKEVVQNPGHEPGLLPKFLNSKGVQCVIAGGMGPRAIGFFNDFGIKTLVGVAGKIEDVIRDYLKGTLKGGQSQCDHPHETKHHKCRHS